MANDDDGAAHLCTLSHFRFCSFRMQFAVIQHLVAMVVGWLVLLS